MGDAHARHRKPSPADMLFEVGTVSASPTGNCSSVRDPP